MQELVRDAIRLLEGVVLQAEEAEALARLVGSREELLAHLLLCRRSFRDCPEIVEEIALASTQVTPGPALDRPEQLGDAARYRAEFEQLDAALRALFAETAAGEAHDKATRALERLQTGNGILGNGSRRSTSRRLCPAIS